MTGELKFGTDESAFTSVLARNSYQQLNAVNEAYLELAGKTLDEVVDSELSGDIHRAAKTIRKWVHVSFHASLFTISFLLKNCRILSKKKNVSRNCTFYICIPVKTRITRQPVVSYFSVPHLHCCHFCGFLKFPLATLIIIIQPT